VRQSAPMTGQATVDSGEALFSMLSRSLHRHLADLGTGFRALIDETRFDIARQMLETSSLAVRRIADTLG
jgi:transcriptional regulator GlxA family with amidase domain